MNLCKNYAGEYSSHLYIFCLKYGVKRAIECVNCKEREKSEARKNTERTGGKTE